MTVDDIPPVGPPPEDFETRQLRANMARELFGEQAPDVMKIDRFSLIASLGAGGQGAVFEAHDTELDRPVALKRLAIAEPESKARMRREARALARVDHPNVVRIFDVSEDETGRPYLVMELVDGQPFDAWLLDSRRHWTQVVEVICAVGDGLVVIHAQGVVHRDVKPKNIVIGKDGTPRLVDLGIAIVGEPASSSGTTVTGTTAGTVGYMAPEHYAGRATARSDQFGLCVTLYEALHGLRPPWSMTRSRPGPRGGGHDSSAQPSQGASVTDDTDPERRVPVDGLDKLPRGLMAALRRGLQHDPEDRFSDMAALVGALRRTLPRPFRWKSLAMASGVVAALGIAIGSRPEPPPGPCDEPDPVLRLWDDEAKQGVREAFERVGAADAGPTFATVDRMLDATAVSLDARWAQACEVDGDEQVRQMALAQAQSQRMALSTIVDGLGTIDGTGLAEVPVRLAGPLGRIRPQGARDACEQTEQTTAPADSVLARIEQLRGRAVNEGIAGHYDQALALGAEALTLAEDETLGPVRARLHLERGRLAIGASRFDEAVSDLEAARSQAEILGCDGLGADALAQLAKAQLLDGRGSQAEAGPASKQALEKLDRTDVTGPRLAEALKNRGLYLARTTDYDGALDHYRQALAIWEAADPPTQADRLGMANTLLDIGVTQAKQGDPTAAIETLERALELREGALWPEHPSMYKLHASLSYRYLEKGELDASRAALVRALGLAEAGLGLQSPRVAMLHMAMVRLLDRMHQFDTALEHAIEADEILSAEFGPDALRRVDALNAIGQLGISARRYDRAITALRRALEILGRSDRASAVDLAVSRGLLGRVHTLQGQLELAEPLLVEALRTFDGDPSLQAHPFLPELLLGWGQNRLGQRRAEEAVPHLQRAAALWTERRDNPERLARTQWWLAQASCAVERERAERSAREALGYYREADTDAARQMTATIESWLERPCSVADERRPEG